MKTLAYVLMDNFCPCFVTEMRKFVNLFQTTRVTNNIFMKDPPPLFALIFLRKKARYKDTHFMYTLILKIQEITFLPKYVP